MALEKKKLSLTKSRENRLSIKMIMDQSWESLINYQRMISPLIISTQGRRKSRAKKIIIYYHILQRTVTYCNPQYQRWVIFLTPK